MADFGFFQLVYVLLLTFLTTNGVAGLRPYTEYHLDEKEICHPFGKKSGAIELFNDHNAAVIVKSTYTFDHWIVNMDKLCKFVFKARRGERLIAVIQNMSLRRNGTRCLDYIKFKRKDGHETHEFCGQIDRRKVTYRPMRKEKQSEWERVNDDQISVEYAEFDIGGEIETTIFVSKIPLEEDQALDLTIVYTPYKDCKRIKIDREEYKSAMNNSVCIWKDYFCDGYQNCVDALCRDEENCEKPYDIVSNGTGTKVTIGAVTTMLLCFVIFLMGVWICRRNKKMCWSSDCAGPSVNENRLSRGERETASSARQSVAVDPMLEVAVLPSVLNKDLPPSYDSLFPEQSNPSAT